MFIPTLARRSKSGQTMVEYALIVSLISIAAIAALRILGPKISGIFSKVSTQL
jgi:pilus assembly protein Flp/PilA